LEDKQVSQVEITLHTVRRVSKCRRGKQLINQYQAHASVLLKVLLGCMQYATPTVTRYSILLLARERNIQYGYNFNLGKMSFENKPQKLSNSPVITFILAMRKTFPFPEKN
jgi:hypothetical protein